MTRRAVIALGGNAMTGPDGWPPGMPSGARSSVAMGTSPTWSRPGIEVVLTHGNGPQVGNLLLKNQLAAHVVPPVPLDWCGAQTQATIGFLVLTQLDARWPLGLPRLGVVTRTLVDPAIPPSGSPTKPIGRFFPEAEAQRYRDRGQTWRTAARRAGGGWCLARADRDPRRAGRAAR